MRIKNWCDKKHVKYLSIQDFKRDNFTTHGKHLNNKGRIELAKRITEKDHFLDLTPQEKTRT